MNIAHDKQRALATILADAFEAGVIGVPELVTLPDGCPITTYVCAVRLPPGCLPPPGRLAIRISAGAAFDAATARILAMLEGLERYNLQHQAGDPEEMQSTGLGGTLALMLPSSRLRLGHPAQRDGAEAADSRGCAVGLDLADAALRGLLELIEHDAVEAWFDGRAAFVEDGDEIGGPNLSDLRVWLGRQGLRLRTFTRRHETGATVRVALCEKPDGLHPSIGSAAGLDSNATLVHAAMESVVGWFNLAALDRNALSLDEMQPAGRRDLELYRGLKPLPPFAPSSGIPAETAVIRTDRPEQAFAALVRTWARPLAVFDLSRPETGLATARVVARQSDDEICNSSTPSRP